MFRPKYIPFGNTYFFTKHTYFKRNKNQGGTTVNKTFNVFSVIALVLTIVGALNWLAIGIFDFNFVSWITFGLTWLEKLLYIVVGAAGVYMIVWLCVSRFNMVEDERHDSARHAYNYRNGKTYGE